MSTPVDDVAYRRHQHVVAAVDLPGVPEGTPGRVMYVAGVTWKRARVAFDNGAERSGLDGRHLLSRDEWEQRQQEARLAELAAEQERRAADARARLAAGGTRPAPH